MKNKVVIIGCGNVGMAYAYALLNQRTFVNEMVLIDLDMKRVEGEVMDLQHCLAFAPTKIDIHCGDYNDCRDAKVVMIAAGVNQEPGETRMDLNVRNAAIFKEIVGKVMESGFNGVFLVATNPVDVMSYLTYKYSGLPSNQVMGTGTTLDTARLRQIIGSRININPKDVSAYVMGEHGDSAFVTYSSANIGGEKISDFISEEDYSSICHQVRKAAYEIIERKGATYYGIGVAMVYTTNAILGDENTILTVSVYDETNEVYVGLPAIINKEGVKQKIYVNLNEKETRQLQTSIDIIKDAIESVRD